MRGLALGLLLAVPVAVLVRGEARGEAVTVKAAFHVHTSYSTGALSLDELVRQSRQEGIDALILTDNFLLRFEYGLFPLRGLVRKVVEMPSSLRMGMARYLEAIEAAQARFPDVILVPGVEVVAYYYWTGSPFTRDLTQWDAQRNLLVVGLSRAEDYERIPAIGNRRAFSLGATGYLKLTAAALALGGGLFLLRLRRRAAVRLQRFTLRVQRRYRLPGLAALGVGALLLVDGLGSSELDPYRGKLGIQPYQAVIDAVEGRGGMVFWSYPEARDFNRIEQGRLGDVLVRTDPHPEVLRESQRYTGFGALYQDTTTLTEPGQGWDRLLVEFSEGRRPRPVWGIGELGYHGPPKRLSDILTVLLVAERSRAAVLRALREGRFYSVAPRPDLSLVLEEFSLGRNGTEPPTLMGGEVDASGPEPLRARVRIAATGGREVAVAARVIRSGRVVHVLEGPTPLERALRVEPPAPGRREYLRLEVTRPLQLLSNPIFIRRRG